MSELQGLSKDEVIRLLDVVSADSRNHAIILLGLLHGFRSSEIAGLLLKDIDLKHKRIVVRRGKGSEKNSHDLDTHVNPLLDELAVLTKALADRPGNDSPFAFASRKGGRLSRVQVFRIFRDAAIKADLGPDKRHYHCLRHTMAFSMIEASVPVNIIQKRGGWRSLSSLSSYLAVSDTVACNAARTVFAAF